LESGSDPSTPILPPNRGFSLKHENLRQLDFKISRSDYVVKTQWFESRVAKTCGLGFESRVSDFVYWNGSTRNIERSWSAFITTSRRKNNEKRKDVATCVSVMVRIA